MNVKVIAVDMDGTFLTSDNLYDEARFLRQFEQMKQQGIRFVVASGNQYYQLRSFFPEIHQELSFIAENGAYIVDQGVDSFVAKLADTDLALVLQAIAKYPEVQIVVCGKNSAYINENVADEYYKAMNFYYHRLQKVSHFDSFDDTIFKIYLHCSEDNFSLILSELKQKIGHIMTPVDCGHYGIDLIIPGINKAHGVKHLMRQWGIEEAETLAFGDSGNDYEMLEEATYSFAMDNAKPAIKEVSKYVIGSNNDGSVLEAIEWLLNGENMFKG